MKLQKTHYFGGHPKFVRETGDCAFQFDDSGITFLDGGFMRKFTIPWNEVQQITVDGPEQAQNRYTVTRLAFLGWFALALKKDLSQSFVTVSTNEYTIGFMAPKASAGELRARFAPFRLKHPAAFQGD